MENNVFNVEITTPQKNWTFDNVIACSAPGKKGKFQVLYNHASLLSHLEIGEIKIETRDGTDLFSTSGGFVEVLNNQVSFLLETCERAENIDVERAEQSAERAKKRLAEQSAKIDTARAQTSLMRAFNRIKVAKKV